VDEQQQSRWRLTRKQLIWAGGIVALALLSIVVCGYLFGWKWTGLVKDAHYHKRTLWDWLQLLIVPTVLALGGYLFTRSENQRTRNAADEQRALDRQIADEQRSLDREIADERRQDDTLQAYLDGMTQLMTDKERPLRRSRPGGNLSTLARARTLTVLSRLDGERKGRVVQFLYESGLIAEKGPVVNLRGADVSRADLSYANLMWARLMRARLGVAKLIEADLSHAKLRRAYLFAANLSRADLANVRLGDAKLRKADLSGANLSGIWELTDEQLGTVKTLAGATMPNGQKYEEWLKDREGRKKDGENE
jgi:hypothetical protein